MTPVRFSSSVAPASARSTFWMSDFSLIDDLIDRLLVEAHLLERLDELGARRLDLVIDGLSLAVGTSLALVEQLLMLLVEPSDLVDEADDAAVRLFLVELLVVVLGVADDVLDADLVLAELVAEVDDLAHGDRAVQDRPEHHVLAVLDALGDLDLALAREERNAPHLAQVHPDWVVRLGVVRVRLLVFAPRT